VELFPLPPELERLERVLMRDPRPQPSMAFRQRVLDGMRFELRRSRRVPRWQLAAACAATFLLSVSLSLAAAQATSFVLQPGQSAPPVREVAKRIQELLPDISPEESLRRATLIEIAAQVGCGTSLGDTVRAASAESVAEGAEL
jgi:hypothetical protein